MLDEILNLYVGVGHSNYCTCNLYTRFCNWFEKYLIRIGGSATSTFPPIFAVYFSLDDWMAPLHLVTLVQYIIRYMIAKHQNLAWLPEPLGLSSMANLAQML